MAESAKKGARISAQMGATWVPNNSVCYDAVNKILPAPAIPQRFVLGLILSGLVVRISGFMVI